MLWFLGADTHLKKKEPHEAKEQTLAPLWSFHFLPFSLRVWGGHTWFSSHTHSHDDHGQSSSSGLFQKSLRSALLSFHTPQGRSTVDREKTKIPSHPLAKKGWCCFRLCSPSSFFLQPSRKMGFPQSPGCPSCLLFVLGSCFPFGLKVKVCGVLVVFRSSLHERKPTPPFFLTRQKPKTLSFQIQKKNPTHQNHHHTLLPFF